MERCFRKIHNLDLSKEYSVIGYGEGKHIYCHPDGFKEINLYIKKRKFALFQLSDTKTPT